MTAQLFRATPGPRSRVVHNRTVTDGRKLPGPCGSTWRTRAFRIWSRGQVSSALAPGRSPLIGALRAGDTSSACLITCAQKQSHQRIPDGARGRVHDDIRAPLLRYTYRRALLAVLSSHITPG